jgi:hypothetical protein
LPAGQYCTLCWRKAVRRKRKSDAPIWQWRESKAVKHQDELWFADRIYATLRWEGPFSKRAYARVPEGQWTFDRPRLLSRDVEVRQSKAEPTLASLVAIYYQKWSGDGTLKLADGRQFDWAPTNFWQTRWAFFDAEGRPLVGFEDTSGLGNHTSQVTFWRSELSKADIGLLATLGDYLMALKRQDDAAAAAAAASAAVAAT